MEGVAKPHLAARAMAKVLELILSRWARALPRPRPPVGLAEALVTVEVTMPLRRRRRQIDMIPEMAGRSPASESEPVPQAAARD